MTELRGLIFETFAWQSLFKNYQNFNFKIFPLMHIFTGHFHRPYSRYDHASFSPDGTVLIDGSTMGIVTRTKAANKWLIIRTSYPDCRNTETFPLNCSNAVSFGYLLLIVLYKSNSKTQFFYLNIFLLKF